MYSLFTRFWVIRDRGLVLSGGICSWSYSWICNGSGGVWGSSGWCRTGIGGCRDICIIGVDYLK